MDPFVRCLRPGLHANHQEGDCQDEREHGEDDADRDLRIAVVDAHCRARSTAFGDSSSSGPPINCGSYAPTVCRVAIAIRFQALIATICQISSASPSESKWRAASSYTAAGTCESAINVTASVSASAA